ncbi:hypothetical protein GF322_05060 [Candidatus Dependentiae bacterium]|nr:hypothetical protein [Candidatus Dependentiae bacterium]
MRKIASNFKLCKKALFKQNIKSFSLIELMLVLSTIIILLTISIPQITFLNKFILKNEVDKIFTLFCFTQQKAITCNQQQEIIFDLNQNSYKINLEQQQNNQIKYSKNSQNKLPNTVKFGFFKDTLGPPSDPKKTIQNAITFKKLNNNQFKVSFYPDGKIEPGSIYFVDKNQQWMMALTVPISNVSYIRKYEYRNKKWFCISNS